MADHYKTQQKTHWQFLIRFRARAIQRDDPAVEPFKRFLRLSGLNCWASTSSIQHTRNYHMQLLALLESYGHQPADSLSMGWKTQVNELVNVRNTFPHVLYQQKKLESPDSSRPSLLTWISFFFPCLCVLYTNSVFALNSKFLYKFCCRKDEGSITEPLYYYSSALLTV